MTENEVIEVLKDEHSYGYELNKACLIAIQALSEIQQYRAIGTVEEVRMLKEKNEPKEIDRYYCPICRHYFEDGEAHNYCPECGQKLDWQ